MNHKHSNVNTLPSIEDTYSCNDNNIATLIKQKKLIILPNLFTLGNGFFGFCSIIFASKENIVASACSILLGALMDMLDGKLARLSKTTSSFGLQLDSLCDSLSFCTAPAFLMYIWQLKRFGIFGLCICALFLLTGICRLARFNITIETQKIYFIGVPTTIAASTLAIFILNTQHINFTIFDSWIVLLVTLILSILMISSLPFPSFKHVKKEWYIIFMFILLTATFIFSLVRLGLIILIGYFLFSFEEIIRNKINKKIS